MKYVNTYTNNNDFASDKSRLDELDDIWAAYVIEDNKTNIKLRQPPAIATYYNASVSSQLILFRSKSTINNPVDSITVKDSSNQKFDVKTQFNIGGGQYFYIENPTPGAEYTAEFVFKTDVDADLSECFSQTYITSLSKGFFSTLQSISNIQGMFSNCRVLGSLPTELFIRGGDVTDASNFCSGCAALASIPEDLFYYFGNNLTNVSSAFMNSNLLEIPDNLFDNNKQIQNFSQCFMHSDSLTSKLTGNTPNGIDNIELWNRAGTEGYPISINGTDCFKNCINLEEYKNYTIPMDWGGPDHYKYKLIFETVDNRGLEPSTELTNKNVPNMTSRLDTKIICQRSEFSKNNYEDFFEIPNIGRGSLFTYIVNSQNYNEFINDIIKLNSEGRTIQNYLIIENDVQVYYTGISNTTNTKMGKTWECEYVTKMLPIDPCLQLIIGDNYLQLKLNSWTTSGLIGYGQSNSIMIRRDIMGYNDQYQQNIGILSNIKFSVDDPSGNTESKVEYYILEGTGETTGSVQVARFNVISLSTNTENANPVFENKIISSYRWNHEVGGAIYPLCTGDNIKDYGKGSIIINGCGAFYTYSTTADGLTEYYSYYIPCFYTIETATSANSNDGGPITLYHTGLLAAPNSGLESGYTGDYTISYSEGAENNALVTQL